jgi:hypothetical protein
VSDTTLIRKLLAIVEAQAAVMAAYRVGRPRTPEKALDVLDRMPGVIEAARDRIAKGG